ncbi:toll/interleukin-1 receptor domain-containing protein, partial [Mesorhizobium sp. M00.F.Ca.ET.186.01.1.1]
MSLEYGSTVFIMSGKFKGRIGYFDDDGIDEDDQPIGYVSLGDPLFSSEYEIPMKYLREATTEDLYTRQVEIQGQLLRMRYLKNSPKIIKEKAELLTEYMYMESQFFDKYFNVRLLGECDGKKLFISHSSKDKLFARLLATDLADSGHSPWLDEWQIKVGESIPASISLALQKSDYVLVILSNNSVESQWVQQEWYTKYWDEV